MHFHLEKFNWKDRLNILFKLLPNIIPKVSNLIRIDELEENEISQDYSDIPTDVLLKMAKHHEAIDYIKKKDSLT
ncbi:hypothetical protein [Roseivirga pacifica]|uniref:hypothetical protein n=1 Tax=Roseivirga pacifica TaxID=1267423 RepID=UPI00209465D1|nr:hypothetical protein [Roseivirga pacifica]MCO6367891.1 hypothetical protein [Roseivirga pacifica]MCO6369627.1 hypothetical protein [Roseivirga pacifica]MCO6373481.1 hypothetical protein [Roseivirga pacifica]